MRFEWDEGKNERNQRKHHVSFETVSLVFNDPYHLSVQDRHVGGEERWQTLGMIEGVVILIVAHTLTEQNGQEVIRIISARKADKRERQLYEQNI